MPRFGRTLRGSMCARAALRVAGGVLVVLALAIGLALTAAAWALAVDLWSPSP